MDQPLQDSNIELKNEIMNLRGIVANQQIDLGSLSVTKFQLSKTKSELEKLANTLRDTQRLLDDQRLLDHERKAFFVMLRNRDKNKLTKVHDELTSILSEIAEQDNQILNMKATVGVMQFNEGKLKTDLSTMKAYSEELEKIIENQLKEILDINSEMSTITDSLTYKAITMVPAVLKTGLKYSTVGMVTVEITGRIGLHNKKPVTYICKKTFGGVKKTAGCVKKIFSKSASKKKMVPAEFYPPMSVNQVKNVIGVNPQGPSVIDVPVVPHVDVQA